MDLVYIWLAAGFIFIIIEMATVSLFGLSMSISSFIVAAYVYFLGIHSADINQIIIFVIISTILIFIFPRFFHLSKGTAKVGIEAYIGKNYKLKKVGKDWKVEIEGVDYLIDEESIASDFEIGKKIKITGVDGTNLRVILV